LREEERQADGATDLDAEAARDDVVGTAGADPDVGGYGREGESGDQGDRVRDPDDQEHMSESEVTDQPPEPQVHDHANDRQNRRREHSQECAELFVRHHRLPVPPVARHLIPTLHRFANGDLSYVLYLNEVRIGGQRHQAEPPTDFEWRFAKGGRSERVSSVKRAAAWSRHSRHEPPGVVVFTKECRLDRISA
jgi:hypothetical protein